MHVSIQSLTQTEMLTFENANVAGDGVQLGRWDAAYARHHAQQCGPLFLSTWRLMPAK
jgi:hypothetical protein